MRKIAVLFLLMQPLLLPSYASAQAPKGAPAPKAQAAQAPNADTRVSLVKAALQLTPEQEKYWPALEQAIRARVAGREQRLAKLEALASGQGQAQDAFDIVRMRATNLSQRGAELTKLADAWQPLWKSLSDDQKTRMEILATVVLNLAVDEVHARRAEMEEDGEYEMLPH